MTSNLPLKLRRGHRRISPFGGETTVHKGNVDAIDFGKAVGDVKSAGIFFEGMPRMMFEENKIDWIRLVNNVLSFEEAHKNYQCERQRKLQEKIHASIRVRGRGVTNTCRIKFTR